MKNLGLQVLNCERVLEGLDPFARIEITYGMNDFFCEWEMEGYFLILKYKVGICACLEINPGGNIDIQGAVNFFHLTSPFALSSLGKC
jgi:hypothetical protein